MTTATGPHRPPGAVELLERAIAYTRGSLVDVTSADLDNPTPCAAWDLRALLRHMDDSLDAMASAARAPRLVLVGERRATGDDALLERICAKACALLGHWHPEPAGDVALGDLWLTRELVGSVGALEITLHGWDVAQALERRRPIPPGLAMDLWPIARDHITEADRPVRFGSALEVPDWATPQARLLAHAGRC